MNFVTRLLLELVCIAIFGLLLAFALWWGFQWSEARIYMFMGYLLLLLILWALISVVAMVIQDYQNFKQEQRHRPTRAQLAATRPGRHSRVVVDTDPQHLVPMLQTDPTARVKPPKVDMIVSANALVFEDGQWKDYVPPAPKTHGRRARR